MAGTTADPQLVNDTTSASSGEQRSLVVPGFFDQAEAMRAEFDERFRDLRWPPGIDERGGEEEAQRNPGKERPARR
jgi:hypothetical protein